MNIEFVSFREQLDTGEPLGRAVVVIIGAIAELERNLIIERVRAGMLKARSRNSALNSNTPGGHCGAPAQGNPRRLNDAHKRIAAVTKALEKRAS
ncbi:MAG TPA: recombinase family protein [Candidatus Angelobacter sp.]|nr:recombinase family protein [Candidatus Angelobacter sp.]